MAALIAMSAAKNWSIWSDARNIIFKLLKRPEDGHRLIDLRNALPVPAFIQAPPRSQRPCSPTGPRSGPWRGVFVSSVMRSPPLAPGFDFETYLVLDDLGKLGRAYREVDEEYADKATVIRDISDGQYPNPVRVVCIQHRRRMVPRRD